MSNPLLIETIRISNHRVSNIKFHNDRFNSSRAALFGSTKDINLRKYIDTSQAPDGIVKCRITYNSSIQLIEYEPYTIKKFNSMKCIEVGDYTYNHKYKDRSQLHEYYNLRGDCDDILMTKHGLITDSYYANVAFRKNGLWYTPKQPLLQGTRRKQLLDKKKIFKLDIHKDDISSFDKICLYNSMVPFGNIVLSTKALY